MMSKMLFDKSGEALCVALDFDQFIAAESDWHLMSNDPFEGFTISFIIFFIILHYKVCFLQHYKVKLIIAVRPHSLYQSEYCQYMVQ